MPPLLAALLMIELGCTLGMVEAIDLGVEWRIYCNTLAYSWSWYDGRIGSLRFDLHRRPFSWPTASSERVYSSKA
jgi:hypothetical protein